VGFHGKARGDEPGRTTAVHYLGVPLGEAARQAIVKLVKPVVVGVDHPRYKAETELRDATLRSIAEDLA
jgi:hypothetical protein